MPVAWSELETSFNRELNLPLWNCSPQQDTCGATRIAGRWPQRRSGCVEDIGVAVAGTGRRKVWMVENVEHLHPELQVEIFRDAPDAVILEDRKI